MKHFVFGLGLAAGLAAQEPREMSGLDATFDGVWRDRAELRGEQPIELVGMEQGGNGFRERTPLLAQADATPARIDAEELRARREAILAGETFDVTPLPRVDAPPPTPVSGPTPPPTPPPSPDRSWLVVVLGACAALSLWAWRSARSR